VVLFFAFLHLFKSLPNTCEEGGRKTRTNSYDMLLTPCRSLAWLDSLREQNPAEPLRF
jgi:hypothetical protein